MRHLFLLVFITVITILLTASTGTNQAKTDRYKRIKLLFAGDIMMHQPQIEAAYDEETDGYYFTPSFEYIKPLIAQADLAVANLELTLPGKPPYTGWPNFKSPDEIIPALAVTGFDLLTTSNNHSNDAGLNGVLHTLEVIDENGLYHTGTYGDSTLRELKSPLVVYKNGFKLAFLNYTYGTDLKPDYPPSFVNKIDTMLIRSDIEEAKKMNPDVIIAFMHWGSEYKFDENAFQAELAEKIMKWGGDIVIGSHPHVVQPIRLHGQDSGNKKRKIVAYSLGNFISNQQQNLTDIGLVLEVELTKKYQETFIQDCYYSTVYRYIDEDNHGNREYYAVPTIPYQIEFYQIPGFDLDEKTKMIGSKATIDTHLANTGNCKERRYKLIKESGITSLFY